MLRRRNAWHYAVRKIFAPRACNMFHQRVIMRQILSSCADEAAVEPRKRSNADKLAGEAQPDEIEQDGSGPKEETDIRESDANVELPSEPVYKATGEGILSSTKFSSLEISEKLLRAVKDMGHEYLTHIQDAAIGPLLKGHDVLGAARTGMLPQCCTVITIHIALWIIAIKADSSSWKQ